MLDRDTLIKIKKRHLLRIKRKQKKLKMMKTGIILVHYFELK